VKERRGDRRYTVTVVTLMKTVSGMTMKVRLRLRDVDEARGVIQEVHSRGRVRNIERSG